MKSATMSLVQLHAFIRCLFSLQQLLEFFYAQSSITNYSTHRYCVYWIVPRNCHDANAITHNNVLALPCYFKARLL